MSNNVVTLHVAVIAARRVHETLPAWINEQIERGLAPLPCNEGYITFTRV